MAALHPEVVHFVIALLIVGVIARAVSLLGRPAFVDPMATTLIVLGTIAIVLAAYTGDLAHGPVEQMPGLRAAVEAHQDWGERARDVFIVVLLIEIALLLLRRWARYLAMASVIVGVVGIACIYEAGEHGGAIVYAYAGGVGTRSGDPQDVQHLLLAGFYQQAMLDRKQGRPADAASLIDDAAQRFPNDFDVKLLKAESLLIDRKDATGALAALRAITPPADNRAAQMRHTMLTADALEAAGQRDGAIAILQQLQSQVHNPRVQQRIDALQTGKGGASAK